MIDIDKLRSIAKEEINKYPRNIFILAHICNLLDAKRDADGKRNQRDMSRSKCCDRERTITFDDIITLIEGLIDSEQKEGQYNGIRQGLL